MLPPSQSVEVRFQGAFLTHPHWKLNEKGSIVINATCTELTIFGERGRGMQRRPHALKLPTKFIVNVLVDDTKVMFQVRDRNDFVGAETFILEFDAAPDARLIGEVLPKVWLNSDTAVKGSLERKKRSTWRAKLASPPVLLGTLLGLSFCFSTVVTYTHHGSTEGLFEAVGKMWGNHPGATQTGEIWRLFLHVFVHADPIDLALQLVGLAWWGLRAERVIGPLVWWITFLVAATAGGICSLAFSVEGNWATGAGGCVQGILMATLTTLWLWRRNGARLPKSLVRDLLVYELVTVVAELALAQADWGQFLGGLVLGGVVALLSWRNPLHSEGLPPRVGRAVVVGATLLVGAWWSLPESELSEADQHRLDVWLGQFRELETTRTERFLGLESDFKSGRVETSPVLFEANRLSIFYRQKISELKELPLKEGLLSDQQRQNLVADLTAKQQSAAEKTQSFRELQTLRALSLRHGQQLQQLSKTGDPEALQRQLEAAREAINTTELRTEWARQDRVRILAEWEALRPPVNSP